jgi:hypothetical protein
MSNLLKLLFFPAAEAIGEGLEQLAEDEFGKFCLTCLGICGVLFVIVYGVAVPGFGWLGALAFCAALVLVFSLKLGALFLYSTLGSILLKLVHGHIANLVGGSWAHMMSDRAEVQNWLVLASLIFLVLLPLVLLRRALSDIGMAFAHHTERETNNTIRETERITS